MSLTLVQRQTAQSGANVASLTATFSPAPTQGNLLVCNANSDSTLTMTSSGWTLAISAINDTGLYQWWKIAGASESTTVVVTPGSSTSVEMQIEEWSGNTATPLDKTASGSAGGGIGVVPSGTTAATTQADERGIVALGWGGAGSATTMDTYTNSYVEVNELLGTGTVSTRMAVAELDLSSAAATSTAGTMSGTPGGVKSGLIGTYKAGAVAVLVPDLVMAPMRR